MRFSSIRLGRMAVLAATLAASSLYAAESEKVLFNGAAAGAVSQVKPSNGSASQVEIAASTDAGKPGVVVNIQPGNAGYPGVDIKPAEGKLWDLSAYGHVEATVTNLGDKPMSVALRVDNSGSNTWNTESATIAAGKTGKVVVIFGYAYGHKPDYDLKPEAVVNVLLFTGKTTAPRSFRIESIVAAGTKGEKPPVDPKSIRIKPKDGMILGAGAEAKIDPATQISAEGGAKASAVQNGLQLDFPAGTAKRFVVLKSAVGRWNLNQGNELHVKVKNVGASPVTPRVVAASDGATTVPGTATVAPGAEAELVVPFVPAKPWEAIPNSGDKTSWNGVAGTGASYLSNNTSGIRFSVDQKEAVSLVVTEIALKGAVSAGPDWMGKRPPVEGDWTLTFDENFDGNSIDESKWVITGSNYWDHSTYWSKENLIVGNGVARMHFEKKPGNENIPEQKGRKYTCGFMQTYGKWVQRYGYFEARMKLPTAPGLWPAFWLMPDRGGSGPQWVRQDTAKGAMEFDIMEHLTRWGPYRYNIAQHWDGYQKQHKQTGTSNIYVPSTDKDGFFTAGLLWVPGKIVYYCQGQEVARWEDPRISNVQSDIMFTMPMGGWDNDHVDESQLPADFVIDYVRVWQRKDLASPVDGVVKGVEKKAENK